MTKTKKKILGLALSASMIASCFTGMSIPASAEGDTSTYTITIPSSLTVANSGWNSIGNISASGTLADGKKLTVSAASANSWNLKSGEITVSYTLNNGSTEKGDAATSWEFTKEQLSTGATQAIGIDVADYSTKPAGTYQDTVTFTAKVEDAAIVYPLGFSKQAWYGNAEGEYVVPANFVSVSQTDAKAAADAEKTSANAPGYVCIYALEGGQYKWIDSHGRTGQHSNLVDIANGDAWAEVYECHNAGDVNSIWFTVSNN